MTMILFLAIALTVAAALKFAAEDRPGFDERSPLS
jgi:hypothetical protein